jgi:Ca2+-transporting ATPase
MDVEHARGMALVALTSFGVALTGMLSRLHSRAAKFLCGASLALVVTLVQIPSLAAWVHLKPLHLDDWAIAIAGGALAAIVPRVITRRFHRRPGPALS